jgi:hypothetical protein
MKHSNYGSLYFIFIYSFIRTLYLFWKIKETYEIICARPSVLVSPRNFLDLMNHLAVFPPNVFVLYSVHVISWRLLSSCYCVFVCYILVSRFLCSLCLTKEVHETALQFVCFCIHYSSYFFFSVLSVSYQRKVGDQLFPEPVVYLYWQQHTMELKCISELCCYFWE